MAKRKKKSSRSGGAWFGLVVGMVLGVAAAVAVALFVTKAPMPFKDKASRSTPSTILPDVANAPDPNIALYGKNAPAGTRSSAQGGGAITTHTEPGTNSAIKPADAISEIIASIEAPKIPEPASKAPKPLPKPAAAKPAPGTQTTYYLQTGAFRSKDDAQAMMARVTMLGLNAYVEAGTSNGEPINRVRVGPFKGIDDMNRARGILGKEKIESAVIRP